MCCGYFADKCLSPKSRKASSILNSGSCGGVSVLFEGLLVSNKAALSRFSRARASFAFAPVSSMRARPSCSNSVRSRSISLSRCPSQLFQSLKKLSDAHAPDIDVVNISPPLPLFGAAALCQKSSFL